LRENHRCCCHICKVEECLFASLSESPGSDRFINLVPCSPSLANFASAIALIEHLHAQRDGASQSPSANEILTALLGCGRNSESAETSQSVLVLAFMPAIHRTFHEVCVWYKDLLQEDIAQQTLTCFLELAASAPVGLVDCQLSFLLARSLRRNTFRWARREQLTHLDQDRLAEVEANQAEPGVGPHQESITLLTDFLDYSIRVGILSPFERDLLIRVKVDGFEAKEVVDRYTVLSPKAVYVRVQRIMKRLQEAATTPSASENSPKLVKPQAKEKINKSSKKYEHFFFEHFHRIIGYR
jgi:DNA-directed RNA polymerase specialized sigma24 family protein